MPHSLVERLISKMPKYPVPGQAGQEDSATSGPAAVLESLFSTLEAKVDAMAVCQTAASAALRLDPLPRPLIHYVLRGTGTLEVEGAEEIPLEPHVLIVLPSGSPHLIHGNESRSGTGAAESTVALVDHMLKMSAGSPDLVLTCGTIEASHGGSIGLFDHLSRPLVLRLEAEDHLRHAFEALLDELVEPRLGSRSLTEALLKQCIILLLRRFASDPRAVSWLLGPLDPRLASAVLSLVEHPAHDVSLGDLARKIGMSRSTFAARFQAAFGSSPIGLLKRIRLHRAAELLVKTDLPVGVVAKSVGYESRTYFSRAFHAQFGVDPRSYRASRKRET